MISRVTSRGFGIAACLAVAAAGFASSAGAAPVPSEVEVVNIDDVGTPATTVIDGVVRSNSRRCIPGRTIRAVAVTPTGDVPIDTARSGARGGWEVRDTDDALEGGTALRLRLTRKTVKYGKETMKCDGETVLLL